jgi:hypothetical protein
MCRETSTDGCIKVAGGLGSQESDSKRRFTPFTILLERIVLCFGDRGRAFRQKHSNAKVGLEKDTYWLFLADLLRNNEEGLQKGLRDCNVTPENINVYAGRQGTPNVLSCLHLTYESLKEEYVCQPVWIFLIPAKIDPIKGGESTRSPIWVLF